MTVTDLDSYDMIMQVYSGNCSNLNPLFCLDEPEPMTGIFPVIGGTNYFFQIGDWGTSEGGGLTHFELEVSANNNDCFAAIDLGSGPVSTIFNNNVNLPDGPPGSCNASSAVTMQNAAWFRWTPDQSYEVHLRLSDIGGYDMVAVLYTGTCVSLFPIACLDEPEPMELDFTAQAGQTYYLQCGDWGTSPGGGETLLELEVSAYPDDCSSAQRIHLFEMVTIDNSVANSGAPSASCNSSSADDMDNDVWFKWNAPRDMLARLLVNPVTYDGVGAVYSGNCGSLNELGCADEPEPYSVLFNAISGRRYYFQVGDWGSAPAGGITDVQVIPGCPGDVNGDNHVNFDDLNIVLESWNTSVNPGEDGDVNGDGVVNFADLEIVNDLWGASCTF
ncbi:MAG: hypothetical protein KDA21_08105 [Phycisphaerales bacterium]|nr:hypothetical protein [Phycisphaerales bacterium]